MAVPTVPAIARIAALSLSVIMRERVATRLVNRKGVIGADVSEVWAGRIEFARLNRADGAALVAFFEGLEGRGSPFLVPLKSGFASQQVTASGTLASVSGSAVNVTLAAGALIPAGTLMAIGDPQTADYQVCEVLTDVIGAGLVSVQVAPRLRRAYAAGTAVAFGTVQGKFSLVSDDLSGFAAAVSATGLSIDVVEGLR